MKQRVSLITLGVSDLGRARRFYEAMGWQTGAGPEDDVVFFQAGEMVIALWDRAKLAEDSCVEDSGGWGGITLALNFGSPAEVDAVIEEARSAGATIGREPAETFWDSADNESGTGSPVAGVALCRPGKRRGPRLDWLGQHQSRFHVGSLVAV